MNWRRALPAFSLLLIGVCSSCAPGPGEQAYPEGRAEADNLVGIYAALAEMGKADVLRDHGGSQFSAFKPALAELAVARMAPIAGEMRRLLADPAYIDSVLADGAERARSIAQETIDNVKDVVGFVRGRSAAT
jgi:tryptophanyl-tRNA synthetase